ncbi:DNA primase [Tahibacter amnicola]|uniref:DNA primase n=1 Tax=Tahibacter amnicola TaxID=2976241 RepID=A0ABY6BF65_9GAMM|nr:DNA primase [Tahibacter amnicola]UXI68236.1 DNA primase [Tahibacter amnicola]
MAGRIPDTFIDDLLSRVDIVDVIQERVPLKKAGRDWTARCPFHDERSPSFTVSPNKQFYHCFGCGAHGSAIKFLMDYDRLEFTDAVEELASRMGLKVPYEGGRSSAPQPDTADLYTLLEQASQMYQRTLAQSEKAMAYFEGRGLDAATRASFGLGYSPDQWDALKNHLGTTPQRVALLEKAGMLVRGERGAPYDRFRDRVMFPILDRRGRTIAFGGRVLVKDDGPKYLNSPETPLFHKGRELFALWQVRQAQQKVSRIIVVEGYMDVIALHQFGLPQAVATLGTATTREHAEVLFRNCSDVYFCFDGDRAGRQAAWRAVESVLPRLRDGRQAHFLFLPDGEDPDSLIRQEGASGFEQRLKAATPLSEFFFAEMARDVNTASLDGKARLAERAKPLLAQIPDGAFRDLMLDELNRRANVQVRVDAPESTARTAPKPVERTLVRTAVGLLLQNPSFAADVGSPVGFEALRQPGVPLLLDVLAVCRARPGLNTAALLEHFADREEAPALRRLAVMEIPGESDALQAAFAGALAQLEKQTVQQRIDDLIRQKGELGLSPAETAELGQLLSRKAVR